MSFDWKKTLASVAPTVATALVGPLGGLAVNEVVKALGLPPDAQESDIAQAIQVGGADVLLKLKEAENNLKVRLKELDIKEKDLHFQDTKSARDMQIALNDWTPKFLAVFVTIGFFGVLGFLLVHGKPVNGGDFLLVMTGSLGTAWTGIVNFYYGSSYGSSRKDILLHNSQPTK